MYGHEKTPYLYNWFFLNGLVYFEFFNIAFYIFPYFLTLSIAYFTLLVWIRPPHIPIVFFCLFTGFVITSLSDRTFLFTKNGLFKDKFPITIICGAVNVLRSRFISRSTLSVLIKLNSHLSCRFIFSSIFFFKILVH